MTEPYKVNPWHLAGHYRVLHMMFAWYTSQRPGSDDRRMRWHAFNNQYEALEAFLRGEQ